MTRSTLSPRWSGYCCPVSCTVACVPSFSKETRWPLCSPTSQSSRPCLAKASMSWRATTRQSLTQIWPASQLKWCVNVAFKPYYLILYLWICLEHYSYYFCICVYMRLFINMWFTCINEYNIRLYTSMLPFKSLASVRKIRTKKLMLLFSKNTWKCPYKNSSWIHEQL